MIGPNDLSRAAATQETLRVIELSKSYGADDNRVTALNRVSLALPPGSFTAIMGPSGSGKSTFLHCAAGLDRPDSGRVLIAGNELIHGSERGLTKLRQRRVGFIFQQFNLLPMLTVLQNVTLPLRLAGRSVDHGQCLNILHRVGLADRLNHRPAELSGGQQQRVAVARALVTGPSVLFADEPTGVLDTRSAREVLALLSDSARSAGHTVVMVTHDPVAATYADSVVFLSDGHIVDRLDQPNAETVAAKLTHLSDLGVSGIPAGPMHRR